MGMFDSVMVPCPECGQEEEFQTKSGKCLLNTYKLAEAPSDVLIDVNRHAPARCDKCGTIFGVEMEVTVKAKSIKWPVPENHEPTCETFCLNYKGQKCTAMHHCKKCDIEGKPVRALDGAPCPRCEAGEPSVWDNLFQHYAHPDGSDKELKMCHQPWAPRNK